MKMRWQPKSERQKYIGGNSGREPGDGDCGQQDRRKQRRKLPMKWKKFKIKTVTDAEDIIISTLYDIGLKGVQESRDRP